MIKLLFTLIGIFSSFTYGYQDYNLLMYRIDYNYTIVGEVENYLLVDDNEYKMLGANDYEYRFGSLNKGKIYEENNQIYVFGIRNNQFVVNIFTKYGLFIEEKVLINNDILNYKIFINNNKIYILGNINNYTDNNLNIEAKNKNLARSDIAVYEFDFEFNEINHNLIGGKLNESVIDVTICNGITYIIGQKDKETGGDLGYGGIDTKSIFIAKLDDNLNINNYIVLDKSINILSFFSFNNNLFLSTSTNLISFSTDLKPQKNLKYLEKVGYIHLTCNNELIAFSNNKGYVYDVIIMEVIDSFYYPDNFNFQNINFFEDIDKYILCEYDDYYVLIDIIKTKDSKISDVYIKDEEIVAVSSVFGEASLIEKIEEYYFDPLVYGEYPFKYIMETKNRLEFSILNSKRVLLESNVIENGLYPCGYNLKFTGKAYLNGQIIVNNYPLNVPGNYKLLLVDNINNEKSFNFTVSKYQRKINDFYQDYFQYEIIRGDNLEIKLYVDNIHDEFIGLYVNEELFDISKINEEENYISVNINNLNEIGYFPLLIEELVYKKEGNLCKDIINNYCYVKVNPKNPSFNLSINDDDSLMFEVNDNDNSLRSIRLYLYNNNLEYFFDYPIFNGAVIINNVNVNETYNFSIMIGYYSGGEISYTNEIITGKIAIEDSELVLGNIYLLNSNESDIRCSIEVNDLIQGNELKQLSYLNNDIILDSKFSYFPVIIFSLVVGGLLFGTIIIFRNKRINKF